MSNEVYDMNLKEELRSCQFFFKVSELEKATHKLFNYAAENLNETVVNENEDISFNNLKCAASVISNSRFCCEEHRRSKFQVF